MLPLHQMVVEYRDCEAVTAKFENPSYCNETTFTFFTNRSGEKSPHARFFAALRFIHYIAATIPLYRLRTLVIKKNKCVVQFQ